MANPTNPNADWPDPDTERAQPGDVLGIERGGERRAWAIPRKTRIAGGGRRSKTRPPTMTSSLLG
jgi:hypothetical protein